MRMKTRTCRLALAVGSARATSATAAATIGGSGGSGGSGGGGGASGGAAPEGGAIADNAAPRRVRMYKCAIPTGV